MRAPRRLVRGFSGLRLFLFGAHQEVIAVVHACRERPSRRARCTS
jgi:hypothetical protein